MRLSVLALLPVLALQSASAQTLAGIPDCAQQAVIAGINKTGCTNTDIPCICQNTAFLTALQASLGSICGEADQQTTMSFAVSLCSSVGQPITIPSSWQAWQATPSTSDIPLPTDTGVPVETAIAVYAGSTNGAPSSSSSSSSTSSPPDTYYNSASQTTAYPTTTTTSTPYTTPPTTTIINISQNNTTTSTTHTNNNNNNTISTTAKKPIPYQGHAATWRLRRGGADGAWLAPAAALMVVAVGVVGWI